MALPPIEKFFDRQPTADEKPCHDIPDSPENSPNEYMRQGYLMWDQAAESFKKHSEHVLQPFEDTCALMFHGDGRVDTFTVLFQSKDKAPARMKIMAANRNNSGDVIQHCTLDIYESGHVGYEIDCSSRESIFGFSRDTDPALIIEHGFRLPIVESQPISADDAELCMISDELHRLYSDLE